MKKLGIEAKLYYGDGHFDMIEPGDYVLCARTGRRIHINQLRYWNVDKQEAYINCKTGAKKT